METPKTQTPANSPMQTPAKPQLSPPSTVSATAAAPTTQTAPVQSMPTAQKASTKPATPSTSRPTSLPSSPHLITTPNIDAPDDFYEALLDTHQGLSTEDSYALNARLVLVLSNHIGSLPVLREAFAAARLDRPATEAVASVASGASPGAAVAVDSPAAAPPTDTTKKA